MKMTYEKKEAVKNGVLRMVLVILSIVIAILALFVLILFAGSKAPWIYIFIHILGLFLVLGIYSSPRTSSISRSVQVTSSTAYTFPSSDA